MADMVIIVGGLEEEAATRDVVLATLRESVKEIRWEWIQVTAAAQYNLSGRDANKHFGRLQTMVTESRKAGSRIRFVKLHRLHGRLQHRLYRLCPDPVLAPTHVRTKDDLMRWLLSPQAGLVPPREWVTNESEAALIAVLCKLLRNKSWNSNVHGHAWTKEADLLGQSPVSRPGFERVRGRAREILRRFEGTLLLSKGGSKTPKEWSISTGCLAAVKEAIASYSLDPLFNTPCGNAVLDLTEDQDRHCQLVGEVLSERVRSLCMDRRSEGETCVTGE